MPYNKELDARAFSVVSQWKNTQERKMFGGVCYLHHGNMLGGVYKDCLIVRIGEAAQAQAYQKPHVRPFDITGKPMKGWVMVEPEGYRGRQLAQWLEQAHAFVKTLPKKKKGM
ncbi:MAG: TfoX/Sxy family protein [Acidobacteriota bacterium]